MNDDISRWVNDLSATEPARRVAAAEHLARLGEGARGAVVPLARATGDASEPVREWAVAALEGVGAPDAEDVTALRQLMLEPTHDDVAYWAVTLVGRLGENGSPAVPELITLLDQAEVVAVRQRAAWALGRIGPAAAEARPALQQASGSDDPRLARLASAALEQIR